jgi:hypothetical protein
MLRLRSSHGRKSRGEREMRTHGNLALETNSLDDRLGNLLDRDLVLLTDGEDDGVDLGVLCERRKALGQLASEREKAAQGETGG